MRARRANAVFAVTGRSTVRRRAWLSPASPLPQTRPSRPRLLLHRPPRMHRRRFIRPQPQPARACSHNLSHHYCPASDVSAAQPVVPAAVYPTNCPHSYVFDTEEKRDNRIMWEAEIAACHHEHRYGSITEEQRQQIKTECRDRVMRNSVVRATDRTPSAPASPEPRVTYKSLSASFMEGEVDTYQPPPSSPPAGMLFQATEGTAFQMLPAAGGLARRRLYDHLSPPDPKSTTSQSGPRVPVYQRVGPSSTTKQGAVSKPNTTKRARPRATVTTTQSTTGAEPQRAEIFSPPSVSLKGTDPAVPTLVLRPQGTIDLVMPDGLLGRTTISVLPDCITPPMFTDAFKTHPDALPRTNRFCKPHPDQGNGYWARWVGNSTCQIG